jgi:hypothetical protein
MREEIGLALDGSAILLVAVGLWLAFQRRGWATVGVLFGVIGLAVISGAAALRAYPNPTRAALQQTADDLRGEVAAITEKWRKAEATVQETEGRLVAETEAKRLLTKTVESLRPELARVRGERDRARSETLSRLKSMMAAGFSTTSYKIEVLSDRELIAGKTGTYFSVRLKDEATGAQFIFPKGRYTIPTSEAAIRNAADQFARHIVHGLNGAADYQVFIRGGADAEPLVGAGELSPEYSTTAYRPIANDGKYAADVAEQSFREPINNNDLPLLRAAYFRSVLGNKLTPQQLDILYNMPSKQLAEEHRSVELVLYVNW